MRDPKKEIVYNPISEARRYVENAKEALQNHGKLNVETGRYEDPKYVKAAGHYLWSGVLIALEAVFHVEEEKKKRKGEDNRVSVDDYTAAAAKRDYKLLGWIADGYRATHLYMGYDGIQDKEMCLKGFQLATNIIDRCESMIS
ncbi:MAG: DUF5618 family protein [Bacteroidales bacterium]|nr:DUF5618 family protein [Bacteroidales bacterium]